MSRVSGCNPGGVPITAWTVKFVISDMEQREIVAADTEAEAEAIVTRDYASLGLPIEIVDVCRAIRKNDFMRKAVRRNQAKREMAQSRYV